jgi:hypothetical protein
MGHELIKNSATDIVGYRKGGEVYCTLSDCLAFSAGRIEYTILRKNSTDEGCFLKCVSCDEYLDKDGEAKHMGGY